MERKGEGRRTDGDFRGRSRSVTHRQPLPAPTEWSGNGDDSPGASHCFGSPGLILPARRGSAACDGHHNEAGRGWTAETGRGQLSHGAKRGVTTGTALQVAADSTGSDSLHG